MAALPVEFHSITDDVSSWPPEISGILRALDAPLPSWCTTGPYNVISPPSPDKHEERTPRLADVFNLALSTVSDIRSLIHLYGPTRSALPFVSTLIQGLAYTCRKEAVILKDVSFVRPRNTTPERGVDGIATLLACHTVDGIKKEHLSPASQLATKSSVPSAHPMSIDDDERSSASSIESEHSTSSGSPSIESDSSSNSSASPSHSCSVSSIDVPTEAHILPGRGRHLCAVLPFLCVADMDNIADLMASVACQRFVWEITEPVVGFGLSETGVVAKLFISWTDLITHVVHIACADDPNPGQDRGLGTFDFTDPTAALSCSQFVLNLANHFAIIFDAKVASENNRLDWRSDNTQQGSDFGSCRDRVERWVRDVGIARKSVSLPPTPPSSPQTTSFLVPYEAIEAMSTKQSSATDGSKRNKGTAEKAKRRSGPRSATSIDSSNKAKSCSSLATVPVARLDATEPHILTWLFDRRASRIGRISFPATTKKPEQIEINEKIGMYDAMCGFLGIPWNENQPPPVDMAVTVARDVLVKQVVDQQAGSNETPATLSPEHQQIICGRLSALLFATLGAYTLSARSRTVTLYEAEFRHDWDALLYYFYHGRQTGISPSVFFEHTIHLARNTLADCKMPDFSELCRSQLQANYDHCSDAVPASLMDPPATEQASAASTQAQTELTTMFPIVDNLKPIVETRSAKEPKAGKVDALLFISIEDAYGLKNEEIIRYNKKVSGKHSVLVPSDKLAPDAAPSGSKSASSRVKSAPSGSKSAPSSKLPPSEHGGPSPGGPDLAILQNPFYANKASVKPLETLTLSPSDVEIPSFDGLLLLPHATAEYKKADADEGKPLNQGRMYLVSVVSFYSTLGIDDYPFYCLVTSGKLGAVLMAWKSSKQDKIYVMERNVVKFDISLPIQAFQFATFLLRLHDDSLRLAQRVTENLKALGETDGHEFRKRIEDWKKISQTPPSSSVSALPSIGELSQAEPSP
ncbi:hypothetical protein C8R47DRAFT_453779 [Mycena vitilis]|nr:hypothetical protein C8R47DRAFT_453779 [Mycena vitilis]